MKKYFFFLLLLVFASFVNANISSIDINYSNYGIDIFQVDNNFLVNDHFTDGDYTNNPTWTVTPNGGGSFDASGANLAKTGAGGTPTATTPFYFNGNYDLNLLLTTHLQTAGDEINIGLNNTAGEPSNVGNGYAINVVRNSGIKFVRVDAGVATTLINFVGGALSGTNNQIKLTRKDGNWAIFKDGVILGSIVSNNYNSFQFLDLSVAGGAASYIDDINLVTPTLDRNYYVNHLNFAIGYTCNTDSNVQMSINDINTTRYALTCNGSNNSFTDIYTHSTQGKFRIKFFSQDFSSNLTTKFSDQNFISDLNAPTIDINISSSSNGFSSGIGNVQVNLTCRDTISPRIDFNASSNSSNIISDRFDANSTHSATAPANVPIVLGECTDIAGNTITETNSFSVFSGCFNFVNESTGVDWSGADINSIFSALKGSSYETSSTYDFKANLDNDICFTTIEDDTVRFDINYNNGLILYREFNLNLVSDLNLGNSELNVCLASPQDFFEQIFVSATQRPIFVQHSLSSCYSVIDYTKYAYQDQLSQRAFTISAPYNLTTYRDGNYLTPLSLSIVNGASESTTQLDVLIFKAQEAISSTLNDEVTISPYFSSTTQTDSNIIQVSYQNLKNNTILVNMKIYDGSTLLFNENFSSSPNDFITYFDFAGIDVNSELLKLVLTKTLTDGSQDTLIRYFDLNGSVTFPAGLGAILAFLFFLFFFTIIGWQSALGFFGIIITIATLAILTLVAGATWVIILQAFFLIGLLYLGLISQSKTQAGF